MLIKALLNKVERFKSFIYRNACIMLVDDGEVVVIDIEPRRNSRPICPDCRQRCSTYDRQPSRLFQYLPVWTYKSYFRYAPRRAGVRFKGLRWRRYSGALARV